MTRVSARDRLAAIVDVTDEDRAVVRAESANMDWDDHIARVVSEAPPLSDEQIVKLRALFGVQR